MSVRLDQLQAWLASVTRIDAIAPATTDASFRRYYRVRSGANSYIVMDAPPDKLDCRPFVTIAAALQHLGLHTPEVLAADLVNGFLLLSDLGEQAYLSALDTRNVDALYGDALDALATLQLYGDPHSNGLPSYDDALLRRELDIFREWFLERHLRLQLSEAERAELEQVFQRLCANALEQPRVWVHRDYHSRNLMITPYNNPGILDFQDSVNGPLTYDLVSLLRDCYIAWPQQRVERWALAHCERLRTRGFEELPDVATFLRWLDLTGVQRHLKAIGLFIRLKLRDGKTGYLADIPRTMHYVLEVAARYPELAGLHRLLRTRAQAAT